MLSPGQNTATVRDLISGYKEGRIKIPSFQRDFVWTDEKVRQLAESIIKKYPIGMLTFYNYEGASYVLDGQQRLLSLVLIKEGSVETRRGVRKIYYLWFNPMENHFKVSRGRPGAGWVKTPDVLSIRSVEDLLVGLAKEVKEEIEGRGKIADLNEIAMNLTRLWHAFNSEYYHVHVYVAPENISIEDLGEIFIRINFTGEPIRAADVYLTVLEVAMGGMADKVRAFIEFIKSNYGRYWIIHQGTIVKTFLAHLTGRVRIENTVLEQTNKLREILKDRDRMRMAWERTKRGIGMSIELLRDEFGIRGTARGTSSRFFLSQTPLVILSYFLGKEEGCSDAERKRLAGWFLLSQFYHRYGSAPDSRLNEDLKAIDESTEALVKKLWDFSGEDRVSRASFKGVVRGKGSNLLMMLYALLRHRNARDFFSDEEIGESSVVHHIFPRVRLEEYNYKEDEIYDIANLTFISYATNAEIRDKLPEEYLSRVDNEVLRQHAIPRDPLLWQIDRYRMFLEERRKLLVRGINEYLQRMHVIIRER